MKLKTGPTRRVHANNTRGAAFCGLGAFVGVGKTQRAHVYTAATLPVGPDDYKKIDPEKLAQELEVDQCAVNSGRFWMMDEVDYAAGDTVDFHGVKMNWAGDMTGAEMMTQFQSAYVPSLIQRNTIWIFHAGKPVHLLREPNGTVWVMQEYTNVVDPSLTPDNLDTVGSKLKNLPEGWKFETKVLTENLSLDTGRCGGWAAIIRDELHCTYQGYGYGADTSASYYVPQPAVSATTNDDLHPKSNSTAPSKPSGKAKRTLTNENISRTVADVLASVPILFEAMLHPKISRALREKLFLAVSSINDCRYCKWGHTHWAMAEGVPLEEVNQILGHQTKSLVAKNPGEAAAILFAQHYAEQLDQFDPDSIENLRQYYSDAEVAEILAYVRFITLTNLTGNTVDVFLTGAHGNGSFIESAIAVAASPLALLLTQLAKFDSQVGMEELRSEPRAAAPPKSDTKEDIL